MQENGIGDDDADNVPPPEQDGRSPRRSPNSPSTHSSDDSDDDNNRPAGGNAEIRQSPLSSQERVQEEGIVNGKLKYVHCS